MLLALPTRVLDSMLTTLCAAGFCSDACRSFLLATPPTRISNQRTTTSTTDNLLSTKPSFQLLQDGTIRSTSPITTETRAHNQQLILSCRRAPTKPKTPMARLRLREKASTKTTFKHPIHKTELHNPRPTITNRIATINPERFSRRFSGGW